MPVNRNDIWSILFALLVLVAVLLLAFFSARWLGRRMGGGQSGGNIEVIDRHFIGQDKSLMIVRAGTRTMLLGITSGQITKLSDIDPTELKQKDVSQPSDFHSIIRRVLDSKKHENPFKGPDGTGGNDPKGGLGS